MSTTTTLKIGFSALMIAFAASTARAQGFFGPGRGGPDFVRGPSAFPVSCSSFRFQPNRCYVGAGVRDVRILSSFSRFPCIQGRTWGYDRNSIWVANGCRGNFLVTTFGGEGGRGGGWGGGPGRPGRGDGWDHPGRGGPGGPVPPPVVVPAPGPRGPGPRGPGPR